MHKILPVIHHLDLPTTLEQAQIAYDNGADGVFLISHHGKDNILASLGKTIKSYRWINQKGNEFFVGLNLLSTSAVKAFNIVRENNLDALWVDNPGVTSSSINETGSQLIALSEQYPIIELFASVAFKYQPIEPEPSLAAQRVRDLGWIPTTSGAQTGSAPEVSKIASMGMDGLLAVASGMTVENIENYLPYLSHILVATGIAKDDYQMDIELLKKFVLTVRKF